MSPAYPHPAIAPQGIQATFIRILPDALTARGLSAGPVWAALGLNQDQALELNRVPIAKVCQALDLACALTGDATVVLEAAQAVRPLHLGALGYALMSSQQGEDGLLVYERFQALLCDEILVRHRVSKGLIEIRHEPVNMALPHHAHFWWLMLGARLCFARWVSARDLVPVRLDIPTPRPPGASAFDRLVGSAVRYDTPDCRELMPADWLAWLNPNADPAMHALMQARSAHQLSRQPHGDTLLLRARAALSTCLSQGRSLSLQALSRELNDTQGAPATSPRQLQNRLAEQGLSFKDLLAELRREHALHLLRDTDQPIAQIAQACGYAEVSPFHRAVRRWTGLTPAQVRAQATAGYPATATAAAPQEKSPRLTLRAP